MLDLICAQMTFRGRVFSKKSVIVHLIQVITLQAYGGQELIKVLFRQKSACPSVGGTIAAISNLEVLALEQIPLLLVNGIIIQRTLR